MIKLTRTTPCQERGFPPKKALLIVFCDSEGVVHSDRVSPGLLRRSASTPATKDPWRRNDIADNWVFTHGNIIPQLTRRPNSELQSYHNRLTPLRWHRRFFFHSNNQEELEETHSGNSRFKSASTRCLKVFPVSTFYEDYRDWQTR